MAVISFLLTAAPQANAVAEEGILSVDVRQAVDVALVNNAAVKESAERVREGEALGGLGVSKVLPSVTGNLSANHQKDGANSGSPRFEGDPYNYYLGGVRVTQPLLMRGFFDGVFAMRMERPIRNLDLEIAQRDLAFGVVKSFYKVLLATRQFETLKKAEGVYKQSLETNQHRYKIGRGQLLNVLQAKTQLALIAPRIQKASNDMRASAFELANQLGMSTTKKIQVKGRLDPPPFESVKEKVHEVAPSVPELSRIRLLQEQSEYSTTALLGKHWPQLNAAGTIGRAGFKKGDLLEDTANAWTIGLELTVPIFSGLAYIYDRRSLESQLAQLQFRETKLKDQFAIDQVKSLEDLTSAQGVIQSSKAALELANESVKEAQRNYKVATIDYLQLLTTQQDLINAELAYDQAKFDYIVLLTKYFTASGYKATVLVDSLAK